MILIKIVCGLFLDGFLNRELKSQFKIDKNTLIDR